MTKSLPPDVVHLNDNVVLNAASGGDVVPVELDAKGHRHGDPAEVPDRMAITIGLHFHSRRLDGNRDVCVYSLHSEGGADLGLRLAIGYDRDPRSVDTEAEIVRALASKLVYDALRNHHALHAAPSAR